MPYATLNSFFKKVILKSQDNIEVTTWYLKEVALFT